MDFLLEKLARISWPASLVQFRNQARLEAWIAHLDQAESRVIGHSRQGQALYGLSLGEGDIPISVIAGCHADEPVGPMTAQALAGILQEHFPGLLRKVRLHIIPQMNPDGADRNRAWFANPLSYLHYHAAVHRELPGDDIEFGFGGAAPRPECRAAMNFLKAQGPFGGHCSLHGLGVAEGAWFLLNPDWQNDPILRGDLSQIARHAGLALHDSDRNGEKGFHRIAPGFCTTPNHRAMAEWFLARDDPASAQRFQPNSMEWIGSLGGKPLCLVSELPLFLLPQTPNRVDPPGQQFKRALENLDQASVRARRVAQAQLLLEWQIAPLSLLTQIQVQTALVIAALKRVILEHA